jgi:hypothetical protein
MTRISGYNLHACPSCGYVHRKTVYSSISVYIPDAKITSNDGVCASCRGTFDLTDFKKVGHVSRLSDEEEAERYAWTLYSIKQGPRPETKPPEPFLLRSWLVLKARFTSEVPKPWEKYPPLA